MSDRRWSRLKTKLLRRSSTSSRHKINSTDTTTNTTSSSTQDINNHDSCEKKPDELPLADPNFTTLPSPLPPLASTNRLSLSSLADSQYPPDEVDSAAGSIRGHYYFVPEDIPADYTSFSLNQPENRGKRRLHDPTDQKSTPPATKQPQPQPQPTLRRSVNNDDRIRAASNRRSLPSELINFPPSTIRPSDITPPGPLTHSVSTFDRPAGVSFLPTNYSPEKERLSATTTEPPLSTPLNSAAKAHYGDLGYQSSFPPPSTSFSKRPSLGSRRQSLLPVSHQHLVSTLLDTGSLPENDSPVLNPLSKIGSGMGPRKIWVKRPGGSATLVPISEDSLVDELRDQVVRKYANSLGKTFDAPDIIVRITARESLTRQANLDRVLSPEEPLVTVVDSYYPGGQMVEEALVIEIPQRRTPKPSPRHHVYYNHEPGEHGDYFPLMPINPNVPTPPTHASNSTSSVNAHQAPSISILTTGVAPPLPSPGSRGTRHGRRPPLTRHATNSPTIVGTATGAKDPAAVPNTVPVQVAPAIPTPPGPPPESPQAKSLTPPARGGSPRPRAGKPKKGTRAPFLNGAFGGLIEGTVPPINVLIVEDNNINQRLLEAFMKRLSVRWKCAANGAEAVKKWREGGFHLVLMDIQLPVMNGLDATKEIRRLERLNGIGVFPRRDSGEFNASNTNTATQDPLTEEDTLHDLSLFKSPVIIVALTASSLQSDRHEALAAGCNDFLTKPVRFEWLEQKVTEWGCMQALIDFEGWRKWRGFANNTPPSSTSEHSSPIQKATPGGVFRSGAPATAGSSAPTSKKWESKSLRSLKRDVVALEDSSGTASGDGSDSPASLHVEETPIKNGL